MRPLVRRIIALCTICFVLLCGPFASAQSAPGSLQGTIRDQAGAVVPGVAVTATSVRSGEVRRVTTDARGQFHLTDLPAGAYDIDAVLTGFVSKVVRVTVAAGDQQTLELTLEIPPFEQTVTVTRTVQDRTIVPYAVTVISGQEAQFAQRKASLAETLSGIPGVFAANRKNLSMAGGLQASIRAPMIGFAMRGIRILQDGIPLTVADGTTNPTNIDLGSVGRIEVIRGPSSVLYGNSAGGVISLETQIPASTPLEIEPEVQFGSHQYQRQQVKIGGTLGRFGYLLDVNRLATDGFRRYGAGETRRANLVTRFSPSADTRIRGIFNFFDMPFGENASTLDEDDARSRPTSVRQAAIDEGWGEASTQGQSGVSLEHRFGSGQVFRSTGWVQWRDVRNPIPGRVIQLGRSAAGLRSEYEGHTRVGALPLEWTAGFDASYQQDDRAEFVNDGVPAGGSEAAAGNALVNQLEEVLSLAPFAQATLTVHPRWFLTVGARYDHYGFSAEDRFLADGDQSGRRELHAPSPMAGLTFVASDRLNVYGRFSTAYQTPTTVELSNRPSGEGGFNEDLEPADLRSVEVGVRGRLLDGEVEYEVTGYRSAFDNAFVEFQRPDEQTFFRNAAEVSRNGIETRVQWTPQPTLRTYLSYTYQNFRFDRFEGPDADFSGRMEPGVPPHQIYAGGSYRAPFGLTSSVQGRWVDAFPVNNANTAFNWSYAVVDVRAGLDHMWGGSTLQPFIGIDNLFGERYNASTVPNAFGGRFYEPSPGRELYVGLSIRTAVK